MSKSKSKCVSCDSEIKGEPAAFAIMNETAYLDLELSPEVKGLGNFHASPVCRPCFVDPSKRKRPLKAHFALPHQLGPMLGRAGSSSGIG